MKQKLTTIQNNATAENGSYGCKSGQTRPQRSRHFPVGYGYGVATSESSQEHGRTDGVHDSKQVCGP
jgi:hypothetical protein